MHVKFGGLAVKFMISAAFVDDDDFIIIM